LEKEKEDEVWIMWTKLNRNKMYKSATPPKLIKEPLSGSKNKILVYKVEAK